MLGVHVSFRFYGELNDFLPPERRGIVFAQAAGFTDTLKHVIESIGVPHTEIGKALTDGKQASLAQPLKDGDMVEVFPHDLPQVLNDPHFVVDGHLGRLAAYLRMLGFDTWYQRNADDAQLAAIASRDKRLLLTRDVGLLKRREVELGHCVRSDKPHEQLREVSNRFALHSQFQPFLRCMDCNGQLQSVNKQDVEELLPPHTRATKEEFSRCENCRKIFWRGSHYTRMLGWIEELTKRVSPNFAPMGR